MKDKRFIDYLNSRLDLYTDGEVADVWRSLINQAKRGSYQHTKLFFEMKQLYVEKKEVTGKDGGPIQTHAEIDLSGLTLEELRNLAKLGTEESASDS